MSSPVTTTIRMDNSSAADPYRASGGPPVPQRWNRYAYSKNDPVNRIDPFGREDGPVNGGDLGSVTVTASANGGTISAAGASMIGIVGRGVVEPVLDGDGGDEGGSGLPDSFQKAVQEAVDRIAKILAGDSDCAKFFGPNAKEALKAMTKNISIDRKSDGPGSTATGISQMFSAGVNAIPSGPYRTPSKFTVYINGPFFAGAKATIAGYAPGSPMAQNAAILHELAHNIKNSAGDGFLIPNDGGDADQSRKNTDTINQKCRDEIFKTR